MKVLSFLQDTGPDHRGRYLSDIWKFSDQQIAALPGVHRALAADIDRVGEQDIAACQDKADRTGLKSGVNRTGNIVGGGVLGLIIGAAGGASAGLIGGGAGVVIGAAAGGGMGLIGGLAAGAYKPVDPDPAYADVVVRCLIGKGYEVSGWE